MTLYEFPARPANLPPTTARNITGRDHYILAEVLVRYIVTEQSKHDDEQAWSDLQDAIAIFRARYGLKAVNWFASHYPDTTICLIDGKAPRKLAD